MSLYDNWKKEKENSIYNQWKKEKQQSVSSSNATKVSQNMSLPTAKNNNKFPTYNYRQNISTKMDRLPTARLASEEETKNLKRVDYYKPLNIFTKGAFGDEIKDKFEENKDKIFNKPKEFEDNYIDNSNIFNRGALGKVGKVILGTETDVTQDLAKGLISPIENALDIGTNVVATGLATGSGALGIKNEKMANDLRNFADVDLSDSISHRVANATPFGALYNIANGTPEKIFNPAEVEYDKNKNPLENYKEGFKKAYLIPNTENFEESSVLGEKADNAVEMIGYSFGNKIFGDLLTDKTGTQTVGGDKLGASLSGGNIGLRIGNHTLNLPTLSIAGGMAGGLQEANSKTNVSEAERWTKGISGGLIEGLSEGIFGALGVGGNDITDNLKVELADKFSSKAGKMLAQLGIEQTGEAMEEFISYASNWLIDNGIVNKIGNADFSSEWDWNDVVEQMVMAYITTGISSGGNIVIENNSSIKAVEQQIGRELSQQEKVAVTQAVIDGTLYEKMQSNNNGQFDLQSQQITSSENRIDQNQNIKQSEVELPVANEKNRYTKSQLDEMLNNKELPMQNYQYVKSDNTKINKLRQGASKYFNNSEQARSYVSMLEKIVSDKNVEIRFDSNLKTPDGRIANGSYSNGIITINPNSSRAGEFIAIHELTHAIGTKEMINMVDSYRKSNTEFNSNVEQILQNYKANEINEEALADVSAQLFGNQEFINNIAQEKPSFFKKIYSEIKYLWHQFKGYKNQSQFIDDLYYKWTEAYNSKNELNKTSNYSTETLEDGTIYVKAENNKFMKNDGTKMTPREAYQSLVGTTIQFKDGDSAKIVNRLPNKDMYNELSKRYPSKYNNVENIKELNNNINDNIEELLTNTSIKEANVPDYQNRHQKQGITNFDTRTVKFYDGKNAYDIDFSIAVLKDGSKIAYAKKYIEGNSNLTQKIKTVEARSEKSSLNQQSLSNNSIPSTKADVNTTTKYSIQESENNSDSFSLSKNFDVTDNENLNNATTLFFRTREDGIYYVQATNGAGNITYDGTFINKKSLAKTLGDDIADYIVNNSEPTNNEIYLHSNKIENKTDYMMTHRPSEEYGNASNFEKNMNGVFEHPEWYINLKEDYNLESLNALRKIRNKPEAEITIYRATPGNEINPGDWVTPSKKYADLHNNSQLNGKGNILELKVKAKDILWGGDDINEFGYFPNNMKYSKDSQSWQQYLEKNFKPTGTRTNFQDILANKADNDSSFTRTQETKVEQEKIAEILEQPKEKVKEKDRTWAILKANLIDKGIVFEELSHKTKNRELQGKWDYTLTATARGQNAIGQARYEMDSKTKTQKQICKSLEDIRAEVGNKTSDFQKYMYHQLNIDRMTLEERFSGDTGTNYENKNKVKNKPVFGKSISAEMSRKIVEQYEQKNPKFKEWAQDVYDFNNANKQELVRNGVISQELADRLSEIYPHYVPIKRIDYNGNAIKVPLDTNRTGVNAPLARAQGGNSDIQPLFQTLAERTMQTYKASARNSFGVELMNTLNSIQETQTTDIDTILEEIGDANSNEELLKEGKNGNAPTFTVFNKGEKVTFEITKDMYDALKPVSESSILSKTIKPLNTISNLRRGVLTEYNPLFLVTNAIKDAQDVVINSQHVAKTYSKFPEAYSQIIKKGYWYNEYVQNGGEQNSYFKDGEFESDKKVSKAKSALKIPLEKISSINNVIEMAPRLAEYIASREKGVSIETAMLDASRVTTNFKAGGDITKFANRNGATFLNASVQGFQQQIRNIQEAHVKGLKGYAVLATKYAVAGLPALILNGLMWKDNDDYKELQDYVKDNYYIIARYGDKQFIRIPKGRMAATMQKIVGNITEYMTNDKELNIDNFAKDFWEDLNFTMDNVAPNNPLDNNVISPIIQVITNKSWYGEDIVPTRLQDKPKAEQHDESTDSLSKWLGEKLNVSPYKINYLLDQYGGGISDIALPAMTKQAENNVVEDKFTTDGVMKNKYPGEFFSKVDEMKVNSNSDKATDKDVLQYKWISNISKTISDFYKEKREIQNSNLSDADKKKQIKEVQKKINELAKSSLSEIDDIKITGNTADVDGTQYYKYKGEWTKLSDEDNKKTQNISLSTYADYRNKVYNMTQTKKSSGEGGNLKDKDKINIIRKGNYSNKEKTELYENYVLNKESRNKFEIIKKTFNLKSDGLDINDYLDYKQQKFEADKKDDGTVKGKPISSSRQDKVIDYINSIKGASYTQKMVLYALEYKPRQSDRELVVNFIQSNWKGKEQEKMLSRFEWITIYKDGRIKY